MRLVISWGLYFLRDGISMKSLIQPKEEKQEGASRENPNEGQA
jgi:hypothetical protein